MKGKHNTSLLIATVLAVIAMAAFVCESTVFGPFTINVTNATTGVEWAWTLPNVTGVTATVTAKGQAYAKSGALLHRTSISYQVMAQ